MEDLPLKHAINFVCATFMFLLRTVTITCKFSLQFHLREYCLMNILKQVTVSIISSYLGIDVFRIKVNND
jgi:hypothetical protein